MTGEKIKKEGQGRWPSELIKEDIRPGSSATLSGMLYISSFHICQYIFKDFF